MGAKKGAATSGKVKERDKLKDKGKGSKPAQHSQPEVPSKKEKPARGKEKACKYSYQDELANELSALGLRLKKIAADGNCFFRALSDQLQGDEAMHGQLRASIMNYIQEREEEYGPFVEDDESFGTYVARMKKDGVWAGNMELVAASHTLGANLTIYQAGQPRWTIANFDQGSVPMLHLSYHDGQHYNSVRMADDPGSGPPQPIVLRGDGVLRRPPPSTSEEWGAREVARVAACTACTDRDLVKWALQEARGDPDLAIEKVVERLASASDSTAVAEEVDDEKLDLSEQRGQPLPAAATAAPVAAPTDGTASSLHKAVPDIHVHIDSQASHASRAVVGGDSDSSAETHGALACTNAADGAGPMHARSEGKDACMHRKKSELVDCSVELVADRSQGQVCSDFQAPDNEASEGLPVDTSLGQNGALVLCSGRNTGEQTGSEDIPAVTVGHVGPRGSCTDHVGQVVGGSTNHVLSTEDGGSEDGSEGGVRGKAATMGSGAEADAGRRMKRGGAGVRVAGLASGNKPPSRNKDCPCGSRRKYKACCGPAAAAAARRKAADGPAGMQGREAEKVTSDEVVGRAAQLAAITI